MKLSRKLIPIISAASLVAVVCPLAMTSCYGDANVLDYKAIYAPYGGDKTFNKTQDEAATFYLSELTSKPRLFADDFTNGLKNTLSVIDAKPHTGEDDWYQWKSYSLNISNVTANAQNRSLSFDISLVMSTNYHTLGETAIREITATYHFTNAYLVVDKKEANANAMVSLYVPSTSYQYTNEGKIYNVRFDNSVGTLIPTYDISKARFSGSEDVTLISDFDKHTNHVAKEINKNNPIDLDVLDKTTPVEAKINKLGNIGGFSSLYYSGLAFNDVWGNGRNKDDVWFHISFASPYMKNIIIE